MLFLVLGLFKLFVKRFESEVDCFFECVGGFVGYEFVLRNEDADDGLLVERGFGFNDFKRYLDGVDSRISAHQLVDFFVDEGVKLLRDVEVDSFDINVHVFLLFLVHGDVRVGNFV